MRVKGRVQPGVSFFIFTAWSPQSSPLPGKAGASALPKTMFCPTGWSNRVALVIQRLVDFLEQSTR